MFIKRILSVFVSILLSFSIIMPAMAQEASLSISVNAQAVATADESSAKVSKDEAKQIAVKVLKDYFEISADDKKFQVSIQFRQDYRYYGYYAPDSSAASYVWQIDFQSNTNGRNRSVSVTVDTKSGKVTSINSYDYNMYGQDEAAVASYTEDQAKQIAEDFLKKINPDEYKQVIFTEDNLYGYSYMGKGNTQYNFRYIRMVNGIPFDADGITVGVNGVTGKIASYTYNWSDINSFPDIKSAIKSEAAEEIFSKETGMQLNYTSTMDVSSFKANADTVKLAYIFDTTRGYMLDAIEGKMVDTSNLTGQIVRKIDLTDKEKTEFLSKAKGIVSSDKEIDSNRASIVIENYVKDLFGDGYEVESLRYDENSSYMGSSRKVWSAQFHKKDGFLPYSKQGSLSVDAATEAIVSVYSNEFMETQDLSEFTPAITWDEAYKKAVNTVAKYFPDKIKEIKTEQTYIEQKNYYNGVEVPERTYYFNFPRVVNGIAYSTNNITVSFDLKTGLVSQIYCNWNDNIKFPDVKNIITAEEAKQLFLKSHPLELAYTPVNKSTAADKPDMQIKLVYRPKSSNNYFTGGYIDAFTGNEISYTGQQIGDKKDAFKEIIKGSWAEKELGILAYQGIIDTADFKPDREITKFEAIKMLVNAKGYRYYAESSNDELKFSNVKKDDSDYTYLQMGVKYGIIDNIEGEFKGDVKITREEMV